MIVFSMLKITSGLKNFQETCAGVCDIQVVVTVYIYNLYTIVFIV